MTTDEPPIYVILPSFSAAATADKTNVTFLNLKNIMTQLPEIEFRYIVMDTPENMNGVRGAYFHIIKDLADITKLSEFDRENHREWFDASGIWLGKGIKASGFFTLESSLPEESDDSGVLIRNRKAEAVFRLFS